VLHCVAVYHAVQGSSNFWVCGWNTKCDHSNESYQAVLSSGAVYVVLTLKFVDEMLNCDHSNESFWAVHSCGAVYYAVLGGSNLKVCDEILKHGYSNKSYWAVLSCDSVYYAVQGGFNFKVCGWKP